MPQNGLFDNLLSLIGGAGGAVGGAVATPPKRKPQVATAPYAGYQTEAQQAAAASAQADAGLAPQLAELLRMQNQARQQATQQGLLNTAAANAAASVVKTGPNAGAAYGEAAGLSDAFKKGYADNLEKAMGGQRGQDASQVLGALTGGAGNLFRTQGMAAANTQDNAVEGILGRGQLGLITAQAQGNKAVSDLDAQRLGIMAQRPGLYQTALSRIEGKQAGLASADATAKYRGTQDLRAAQSADATALNRAGVAYQIGRDGWPEPLTDEQGHVVLTPQGQASAANASLVGMLKPDVRLSTEAHQWVDSYGRPIPGWENVPPPKAPVGKAPKVDLTLSQNLGYWVDTAGNRVKSLANQPVPAAAAGAPKVNVELSKAMRQWVDATGTPIPGLEGKPVPKSGKTKQPPAGQMGAVRATASRIAGGAYNGFTETAKGSGYPGPGWDPVRDTESPNGTIIGWQRVHPQLGYQEALKEMLTLGDPKYGPIPLVVAQKALNKLYKRGERGRPMLSIQERQIVSRGGSQAVNLLRQLFGATPAEARKALAAWAQTGAPADFGPGEFFSRWRAPTHTTTTTTPATG